MRDLAAVRPLPFTGPLNLALGALFLEHHRAPGRDGDPDAHPSGQFVPHLLSVVASTLIVFTGGIFLVHHPALLALGAADTRHRAVGVDLGQLGSLVAILFLNTHWLHHEHPQLTWLRLGLLRPREPRWLGLGAALAAVRRS